MANSPTVETPRESPVNAHVPEYIRGLVPYVPGKPIEETQRELGIKRVIKLASNENPLGPSPKAIQAVRKMLPEIHRYPDGGAFALKQALARALKIEPASLIVGNGSNEIIDFLVRTYCVAGEAIVTSKVAFIAYKLCAQVHGVRTLEAELTEDLRFDLGAILEIVKKNEDARVVFIANPNNPTGTHNTTAEMETFLRAMQGVRGGSVLVVLDYAYWEYVDAKDLPDPMALMRKYPNAIVLRTFSKVYGLAGFRVGYGAGAPEIIRTLEKVRQPFNLNSPAMCAAIGALGDRAFVQRARKINIEGRRFWEKTLKSLGIPYWPTQGNFILIDTQKGLGQTGPAVYQECLKRGVIFRPIANYGMPGALRISIGTMAENRIAAKALAAAAGKPAQTSRAR
jgi:histidinol-phosphate aminotransferase